MKRSTAEHCSIEFKLYTESWQADKINKLFDCAERMYNTMIRHANSRLARLREDAAYKSLLSSYIELLQKDKLDEGDKSQKSALSKQLNAIVQSYGLSEFQFHSYIKKMRNNSFNGKIHSDIAQKIATEAWYATADVLYKNGKKLHFKKKDQLQSFEGKKNTTGIRFDKETNSVILGKMTIPIKLRHNDNYARQMLAKPICYCRIVRKLFKTGYKYFVQLILKGKTVKVPKLGVGDVGIDQGTSTIAAIGDYDAKLLAHGITDTKTIKDYNKEIIYYSRKLERSLRINNPKNYDSDGVALKNVKSWIRTKNYYRTLLRLKDAYRRKAAFVKQLHNKHANQILLMGDNFYTEMMSWKALQKRSKKTEKSDEEILVTNKNGESKKVKKNKKKKRFGKSLENYSPGILQQTIEYKLSLHHKCLKNVNVQTYKASQYNPETKTYNKAELNERVKTLYDKIIQRDLLSAFLLQNPMNDLLTIDINKVEQKLDKFIAMHDKCIAELKTKSNMPECMGLKHFQ